jgi:hypothetical protein
MRTNGSRGHMQAPGEGRPSRISAYRKNPTASSVVDKSPLNQVISEDSIVSPTGIQSEHEVKNLISNIQEV